MKIVEKLKSYMENTDYKKITYNLLAVVIICTIALITWDTFYPESKKSTDKATNRNLVSKEEKGEDQAVAATNIDYKESAEVQLKNILSEIKGVGEVDIMVTYESTTEVVPALNVKKSSQQTEEKDSKGGVRTTTQDDSSQNIVMTNEKDKVIVIKEIKPQIRGVVIVAEGAADIKVKTELIEAVRTIFQIPAHKVMVYEKK